MHSKLIVLNYREVWDVAPNTLWFQVQYLINHQVVLRLCGACSCPTSAFPSPPGRNATSQKNCIFLTTKARWPRRRSWRSLRTAERRDPRLRGARWKWPTPSLHTHTYTHKPSTACPHTSAAPPCERLCFIPGSVAETMAPKKRQSV